MSLATDFWGTMAVLRNKMVSVGVGGHEMQISATSVARPNTGGQQSGCLVAA